MPASLSRPAIAALQKGNKEMGQAMAKMGQQPGQQGEEDGDDGDQDGSPRACHGDDDARWSARRWPG